MSLDIRKEAQEIQRLYTESKANRLVTALVIGPSGSGKTKLLETCRRPIHVDSFDPDGTTTIRKGINEGWILADTRYEREDPTDPYAFELWDSEYNRRKDGDYFSNIGTYALDFSMWCEAIMNLVLKGLVRKADRSSKAPISSSYLRIPQENDWPIQMNIIKNALTDILSLPCDIMILGHTEDKKDKQGTVISRGLYVTGKLTLRLPRLFEEIWYMKVEETAKGPEYYLMTQRCDGIDARTRLGRDVFEYREKPDVMYLLEKAGLNPKHLDMEWLRKES